MLKYLAIKMTMVTVLCYLKKFENDQRTTKSSLTTLPLQSSRNSPHTRVPKVIQMEKFNIIALAVSAI
jgi:hypothetical protein